MLEFLLLAVGEEGPRPFPELVVGALLDVVRCDTVAFRAWGSGPGLLDETLAPPSSTDRLPPLSRYHRFRAHDPHPSAPPSSDDPRPAVSDPSLVGAPLVLTDAVGRGFRETGLYRELMRPAGFRDVMKLFFPVSDGIAAALVFDTSAPVFSQQAASSFSGSLPR